MDEPGRRFEALYNKYLLGSYNKYSHEDTEIIIFDKEIVEVKQYEQE